MKGFKLLYLLIISIFLAGCAKNEILGIGQQGDYIANFDFPTVKVFAPGKVGITNRSKNANKFLWEFSGAKRISPQGDTINYEPSEKMVPDSAYYELPGEYTVKLTTWQDGQQKEISKKIVVEKQQPMIVVPENIGVYLEVTFAAKVFQYPGQAVTYNWDFGSGITSTEANPKVTFTQEGPRLVKLTINDGKETLTTEALINVQGELARTLYFTDAFTRSVYKIKLTTQTVSQVQNLNIATGYNPFGLSVNGNKVYLSSTGLGITFSSGVAGTADGILKSFNLDGTAETIISKPVPNAAIIDYRMDPWKNTIDKNGNIWWTTRNYGAYVLNASGSELPYPTNENQFKIRVTATHAGESVGTYFASDIKEVGDEMWISYAGTTGKGIYKFKHDGTYIGKFTTAIQSHAIRSFVVDKINGHIYFATNRADAGRTEGIYRADMDGSNIVAIDNSSSMLIGTGGYSNQGAAGEYTYVMGLDLSVDENGQGYLYYGYRAQTDVSGNANPVALGSSAANSGIKRYKLGSNQPAEFLLKGFAPYGLSIDQVKR